MKSYNRSAKRNLNMNSLFSFLGLSLVAALFSSVALGANLQSVDVASLPGDHIEALDLPGVSNHSGVKSRELGTDNARSVTLVETKDRTRMIVNLTNLVPYHTRVEGNTLYVRIGTGVEPSSPSVSAAAPPAPASAPAVVAPVTGAKVFGALSKAINNIDFQRGEQGEGNVVIDLSNASVSPDVQEQGGKIVLNFKRTALPEALRVRLDVKDFATPVQFVSASATGDDSKIVIEPVGAYDYLAYQTDNKLTLSVKPLTQHDAEKRQAERFAYSGEKLSLNFQDIDVRSVLQLIADFTDLNLVASDTVSGNITLRLQNVPWDQALDLVLKTKGLDKRQVGNVLLVAPAEEIAARERQELESQRQIAELAPLRRELIQVNYANAANLAKLFQSVTSANGTGATADERGSITVDDRTNSIIAYQTQERLDELRRIVAQLDVAVRQVMIEARIVEANVNYDKSLGVRWGASASSGNWSVYGKDGAMSVDDDGTYAFPGTDEVGTYTLEDGTTSTPFVDLGVTNSTSGIGLGFVSDNLMLDLQLSAMESSGNGEVVSQPKVVTSDKMTAKILKGEEVPYQEASSSGATTTSFKEAALSLEVTPQITPDNRIIMAVKVNKDAPNWQEAIDGVPPIDKNEVNAKVLVADGETIVIGGVFENTQSKSVEKVPFLGDIPYLGRLFRRDIVQDNKTELLVFITPRIMNTQAVAVSR
jgi:type IV pilus assembly protein PilQ